MRDIKFRAYDKRVKRFVSFNAIYFDKKNEFETLMHNYKQTISNYIVLMQYTGLKDKNGVEIYEGDILNCIFDGNWCYKAKVVFHEGCFAVDGYVKYEIDYNEWQTSHTLDYDNFNLFTCEEIEVIGNIYENPELLELK